MCGCITEEELLANGEMEETKDKKLPLPAGLHIESGWADEERLKEMEKE